MRNLARALLAASLVALWVAAPAQAEFGFDELGFEFTDKSGEPQLQAGTHPFAVTTTIAVNSHFDEEAGEQVPDGSVRNVTVDLPAGFAGNPTATPRCTGAEFATIDVTTSRPACADETAVGTVVVEVSNIGEPILLGIPVYNLVPGPGTAAKLGFVALNAPVTVDLGVNESPPYNVRALIRYTTQAVAFFGSELTVWGNPADPDHDPFRGACLANTVPLESPEKLASEGSCSSEAPEKPFVTLPRSCTGPLESTFEMNSWQNPGVTVRETIQTPAMTECQSLGFGPEIAAQPTTDRAESPSGLDFRLSVTDEGLTSTTGTADSDIRRAEVVLPRGMTINPSQAEGLGACSEAQLDQEGPRFEAGRGCPEDSKIGTIEVETPLLEDVTLRGSLYVARPYDNLAGDALIAFYIVIREPELGIVVTQPARVEADEDTGRLTTTTVGMPQLPFSEFRLRFRDGDRSPLVTPPACGDYEITATFTPWADPLPDAGDESPFEISRGLDGGECPSGPAPFDPGFEAGTLDSQAGAYSPFFMRITRPDGDQDLSHFTATLPPGLTGKLAGVARCPDSAIAAAEGRDGQDELDSPSCPAASRIGSTLAGAGVGDALTYVPGSLYLAGPFRGAPLSVAAISPAVAGPFDLGTVVVRQALDLDPVTAQVKAVGSSAEALPHMLEGIPLKLRDLRVSIDREEFTLNPTSCSLKQIDATLVADGTALDPGEGAEAERTELFQASDCGALGFAPRMGVRLFGGVRRGAFPALRAVYAPGQGQMANLRRLALVMPNSAFVEQGHFGDVCTRVQYAAEECPPRSVYGRAVAYTPLLGEPLRGPVYLRPNGGVRTLPDVVLSLRGIVDVEVTLGIDSVKGRLRASTIGAPDVPVSRVVVQMQGGQKGLFVNSRHLCFKPKRNRARINTAAHNNAREILRPLVRSVTCAKRRQAARKKKQRARRARVASVGAASVVG